MLAAFLNSAQALITVVLTMVVVVLVTAALETNTPIPRRRATRLSLPRRVNGPAESLPDVDLALMRRTYDHRLAELLRPKPTVLLRPGPNGPEPISVSSSSAESAPPELVPDPAVVEPGGPPTERVPVVPILAPATAEDFAPPARTSIREAVRHRMAPAEPWIPAEHDSRSVDWIVPGHETSWESALDTAIARLAALDRAAASGVDARPGGTTAFVVRLDSAREVDQPPASVVEVGEPGADRELSGVLFAAYVVAGLPERRRVTGWVTPLAVPPSLPEFAPSDRLRGRPGRIAALLGCRDESRNWVTLDARTDIRRGLRRAAPTDPVLQGLVSWWVLATDERARIPASEVATLLLGLEAVVDVLGDHPCCATVRSLIEMAREAQRCELGLRLESVPTASLREGHATDEDVKSQGDVALAG